MIETILAFLERETKNLPIWVVDPKLVSVAAGTLRLLIIVIWHQTSLSLFMIWRMLENIECYGKAVRRDFEARPFSQFSLRGALKKRLNLGKFSQMCEPTHSDLGKRKVIFGLKDPIFGVIFSGLDHPYLGKLSQI